MIYLKGWLLFQSWEHCMLYFVSFSSRVKSVSKNRWLICVIALWANLFQSWSGRIIFPDHYFCLVSGRVTRLHWFFAFASFESTKKLLCIEYIISNARFTFWVDQCMLHNGATVRCSVKHSFSKSGRTFKSSFSPIQAIVESALSSQPSSQALHFREQP